MTFVISFKPMTDDDIPFWNKWVEKPQVKNTWFIEGYYPPNCIYEKLQGNGYDYPFIIYLDEIPIGYIQCSDLYAYRIKCKDPKGVFTEEDPGTFCIDLFVGEENYLDKGYGTKIVESFIKKIILDFNPKKILIDPTIDNKRAIRCYEKAGFKFLRYDNNGIKDCYVMEFPI